MPKRRFAAKITTMFGCSFRSRLEAHVACTLTTIGVSWKYEPRLFRINKSILYLPDFKCSFHGEYWWWECKPKKPSNIEVVKAKGVARIAKLPVLVSCECPFFSKNFNGTMYVPESGKLTQYTGPIREFLGISKSDMELYIADARDLYRQEMAA